MFNKAAASTRLQGDDPSPSGAVPVMLSQWVAIDRKVGGCRSAGRNLKSFKQIGNRRVETPCDDLQRDSSRLALATFNVRQVSPVHVEMDGEIICV
jgi:hypothetical protein